MKSQEKPREDEGKIIKQFNALAMSHIQQEEYQEAWEVLKKAEGLVERNSLLKALTFNNFACLYRKLNRPKAALSFLEQALNIEYKQLNHIEDDSEFSLMLVKENPADTHLNICAILSMIGKHEMAYLHALKALTFLQAEIFAREFEGVSAPDFRPFQSRCSVLCIAYYNLGAELEFLGKQSTGSQLDEAHEAYSKALKFAEKYLGKADPLTKTMRNAQSNVKEQQEKERNRRLLRQSKSSNTLFRSRPTGALSQRFHKPETLSKRTLDKKIKDYESANQVRVIIKPAKRVSTRHSSRAYQKIQL